VHAWRALGLHPLLTYVLWGGGLLAAAIVDWCVLPARTRYGRLLTFVVPVLATLALLCLDGLEFLLLALGLAFFATLAALAAFVALTQWALASARLDPLGRVSGPGGPAASPFLLGGAGALVCLWWAGVAALPLRAAYMMDTHPAFAWAGGILLAALAGWLVFARLASAKARTLYALADELLTRAAPAPGAYSGGKEL
jgi:hypothetical protein